MPPVALTLGDPSGIGPEIIVKTFVDRGFARRYPAVVIGDSAVLRDAAERWGGSLAIETIARPEEATLGEGRIPVVEAGRLPALAPVGQVDAECGRAAAAAVRRAVELALDGSVVGICTAPIHKESLAAAGSPFPGHTEMLAAWSGSDEVAMVLANKRLKTLLVTVHCSLRTVLDRISTDLVFRAVRLAHASLRRWGTARPRIAVAGLNPHAGEGGLFGHEDSDLIAPAVALAREQGVEVSGPYSADTIFMRAWRGEFDIVVAQYHDQGLIPIKLLGFEDGVNITAGLPYVRTSPDHGTAFDIAGKGIADPSSLKTALAMAHRLAAAGRRDT